MVSSPAYAAANQYQISASSTPVLETAGSKIDPDTKEAVPVQKQVTITARLTSPAPDGGLKIPITSGANGDTAKSGADDDSLRDYDKIPDGATIDVPAGKTTGTYKVTLYDDDLDEADTQYFSVTAAGSAGDVFTLLPGAGVAKAYIQDDEATPSVTIEDAGETTEDNELVFPLTLSGPSERDVNVKVTTANGVTSGDKYGAVAPGDYDAIAGAKYSFEPGTTSSLVLVKTIDDKVIEASPEMMSVSISSPMNATLGSQTSATGGINDASEAPSLTVYSVKDETDSDTYDPEGNSGETAGFVYVKLSKKSTIPVRLNYMFGSDADTATNGVDYKGTDGTLTIAPGDDSAKIPVSIVGDKVYEPHGETFTVAFTSPNGSVDKGSLGDDNAYEFTITDDDMTAPTYSIGDFAINEGNSGVTTAKIPVTLSGPTNKDVSLDVEATDGDQDDNGATEEPSSDELNVGRDDYDAPSSPLIIKAGDTVGYAELKVNGDVIFEHDETVNVKVSATDSDQQVSGTSGHEAVLTIRNDDDSPTIKFNESSGSEGTFLRISADLVGQSQYDLPLSMTFGGNPGDTATKDTDYSFQMGNMSLESDNTDTMTIPHGTPPGPLWNSAMALVYLDPDNIDEPTETASILVKEVVSGTPIGFKQTSGVYKINDDPGDLPPSASVGDATTMGNAGTVNVPVNLAFTSDATSTTQTVTVPYWTTDGTAKAGSDYTTKTGTLSFAPGELTKNVIVPIANKTRTSAKKFYVKLGSPGPAGASVTDGSGDVTIQSSEGGGGTGGTATTITTPAKVTGGAAVPIKGKAEPGATVELWGAPWGDDSELKRITTTKADSNGNYSFSRWIGSGYRFKTRCNDSESAEKKVQVEQDPYFKAGPPSRGSVDLTVTSDPKDPGQPVIIQRWDGRKWANTTWKGTTDSKGQWKGNIKPGRGSWKLRAFVQGYGPDGLLPGYSDGQNVTIK
ncbi:Calx-beta domain-containing protein [Actinoplanes sp. TBRC 11911]|uniref:Calx-beta domain-containing protein n=1 Tax=Actinoplanes sp. TBRC 11911 TaxID=2729386 RepID=UPI0020071987|nr:Calx-beta domain-containing protein [Actinoplanes sp. TBRC 11911]